jgi:hypothetical protein
MATDPVVLSLLDTDLYKFTMWQPMLHRHPGTRALYRFVLRNTPAYPLADLLGEVDAQLDHLCSLRFRHDELEFLGTLRFLRGDFIDFLRIFQFQREFVRAWAEGGQLRIEARGPQVHVMGFEIFVLAIVNELYFRRFDAEAARSEGRRRLAAKIAVLRAFAREPALAHPFEFFDFGVRRRYAREWQREVVGTLARELPQFFKGTSNVLLAREFGLTPIGTMGHEYLQTFQATGVRLRDFQRGRPGGMGAGVPRRPGHRAHRHGGHGRLPGRFRPLLRQAVRRPAARFRGPRRLGREGAGALRAAAHRRARQAAGVLRRPRRGEDAHPVPPLRRPGEHGLRHRHPAHQRRGAHAAEHRDEAGGGE